MGRVSGEFLWFQFGKLPKTSVKATDDIINEAINRKTVSARA